MSESLARLQELYAEILTLLIGREILPEEVEFHRPPKHIQADWSTAVCFKFSKELKTTPAHLNKVTLSIIELLMAADDKRVKGIERIVAS